MNKILFILFTAALFTNCPAQTAVELNDQSKKLLLKGETAKAVPIMKKAAELGNAEAQYNYAYSLQKGIEVTQNDSIANIWLLRSAQQGWIDAQFKIAYSYAVGRGIKKDLDKAFSWSMKCAQQNDPDCISNIIACYTEGKGITLNYDSASVWNVRLASLPDVASLQQSSIITNARINLALAYRDGNYYPKDKIKSYRWFLIYNESKKDFSVLVQQNNIDAIKELEKNLSATEKEQAKLDAEKQINRKLNNLDNLYKQEL